jgi:hypothetical protein
MPRPSFITQQDIERFDANLDADPNVSSLLKNVPEIREVCYSGIWIGEELGKLECPEVLITRIQFTAGRLSFGNDCWKIHQDILEDYKIGKLNVELDGQLN